MATEFAVVRAQAQTAGGTQDITSSSITDFSAAIGFIYGHAGDGGSPTAEARMGAGICIKTGSGGVAMAACTSDRARNGVTPTANAHEAAGVIGGTSRFLSIIDPGAGAPIAACNVIDRATSGLANGIRLSWTTTPDAAYEMVIVLIGGLANQAITVCAATTTVGFETDFGVVLSTSGSFSGGNGSFALDAQPNLGFFKRVGLGQVCTAFEWNTGVTTTDADSEARTNRAAGQVTGGGGTSAFLQLTAITATQLNFTVNSVSSFGLFCELADDAQVGVALESIPSVTGVQNFTGMGFAPSLVVGGATGVNASDTLTDGATAAQAGYFASSASVEGAGCMRINEGVLITGGTVTQTSSLFESEALLLMDETETVVTRASRDANTSNGWQLNFSAAGGGRMAVLGLAPATLISVNNETEQISDAPFLNLISYRALSETETVQDSVGGLILADGLSALGPNGAVFQGNAVAGRVLQANTEAGVVECE